MKRIITIIVIIALLAAGWYAYKAYTGKVKSLTKVDTEIKVTATELISAFETDSATANKKYLGKILEVTGTAKSIEKDGQSATVVLGTPGNMSSVRCSMDTAQAGKASTINEGANITVKGACTGFISEELLGSDVILNRCIITSQ